MKIVLRSDRGEDAYRLDFPGPPDMGILAAWLAHIINLADAGNPGPVPLVITLEVW